MSNRVNSRFDRNESPLNSYGSEITSAKPPSGRLSSNILKRNDFDDTPIKSRNLPSLVSSSSLMRKTTNNDDSDDSFNNRLNRYTKTVERFDENKPIVAKTALNRSELKYDTYDEDEIIKRGLILSNLNCLFNSFFLILI
jgi:hypothetical protein